MLWEFPKPKAVCLGRLGHFVFAEAAEAFRAYS